MAKKFIGKLAFSIIAAVCLSLCPVYAQSNPGIYNGQTPTAAQWNSYFAAKQDYPAPGLVPGAGLPSFFIAAYNAPALVKARADYVCTGTSDSSVGGCLALALAACPAPPVVVRSGRTITPGKTCTLQLSEGQFNISTAWAFPTGSILQIYGTGVSSWIPIDALNNHYEGGTIIYSTDTTGACLTFPKDAGGFPTIGLNLHDIECRVFNPSTNVSGAIITLDGMITGVVRNINALADLSTNATQHIATCVSYNAGASSDRKLIEAANAYNCRQFGWNINTTHTVMDDIGAGNISNDAFSSCYSVTGNLDNFFAGFHSFSCHYGFQANGASEVPVEVQSLHLESVTTPALISGSQIAYFHRLELDGAVTWSGDITTKGVVDEIIGVTAQGKLARSQNNGSATLASGGTSIVVTHGIFTTPTKVLLTQQDTNGAGAWADTYTTTQFTIHIPSMVGSDAHFTWVACVACGS